MNQKEVQGEKNVKDTEDVCVRRNCFVIFYLGDPVFVLHAC